MKNPEFDLCIIGGAAGLVAAAGGATLGAKVALVEKHRLGGDCLYYGCVPSKSLLHAAKIAHTVRHAPLRRGMFSTCRSSERSHALCPERHQRHRTQRQPGTFPRPRRGGNIRRRAIHQSTGLPSEWQNPHGEEFRPGHRLASQHPAAARTGKHSLPHQRNGLLPTRAGTELDCTGGGPHRRGNGAGVRAPRHARSSGTARRAHPVQRGPRPGASGGQEFKQGRR